jgi:DNA-directed RNA polymerase specialized sigma24 family protein
LKFVERLSNVEIGIILNRSDGAVKSLYHRTLLALRDDLVGMGVTDGQHRTGEAGPPAAAESDRSD